MHRHDDILDYVVLNKEKAEREKDEFCRTHQHWMHWIGLDRIGNRTLRSGNWVAGSKH